MLAVHRANSASRGLEAQCLRATRSDVLATFDHYLTSV